MPYYHVTDLTELESRLDALDGAIVPRGDWDASAGVFPDEDGTLAGYTWTVAVGGTVDGVEFAVGDRLVAEVDDPSTVAYAGNWLKLDHTDLVSSVAGLDGAITAPALRTAINVEDGAAADQSDAEMQTAINNDPDHGSTAQHDYYEDSDAVAAMGARADGNPLNHDRYTDAEARAAVVNDSITNGNTDTAPSEDAVHAALADKLGLSTANTVVCVPGDDIGAKITAASGLTPGGSALSTDNRAQVVVMAGDYTLAGDYTHSHEFVDVTSLTGRRDVRILGDNILFTADDIAIRGIDFSSTDDGYMALSDSNPLTAVENCHVGGYASDYWTEDATTYVDCTGGDYAFGGSYGTMSGACTNCTGGADAFGGYGTMSGKCYYCRLTSGAFTAPATDSGGLYRLCIDGNDNEENRGPITS